MGNGNAWLEQAVLAEFISSNAFTKHLRRIRRIYISRRDCLVDTLNTYFGHVVLSGQEGGTHLVWHLPESFPEATKLKQMAEEVGVGIYTLESAAAYENGQKKFSKRTIILGYATVTEDRIREGVARIASILKVKHMLNNQIL